MFWPYCVYYSYWSLFFNFLMERKLNCKQTENKNVEVFISNNTVNLSRINFLLIYPADEWWRLLYRHFHMQFNDVSCVLCVQRLDAICDIHQSYTPHMHKLVEAKIVISFRYVEFFCVVWLFPFFPYTRISH